MSVWTIWCSLWLSCWGVVDCSQWQDQKVIQTFDSKQAWNGKNVTVLLPNGKQSSKTLLLKYLHIYGHGATLSCCLLNAQYCKTPDPSLFLYFASKEPDYLLMLVLSNHSPGFLKVKDNAKDNSFKVLKLYFLYKQDYSQHENLAYFTIVCSVTLQNWGKWTCGGQKKKSESRLAHNSHLFIRSLLNFWFGLQCLLVITDACSSWQ